MRDRLKIGQPRGRELPGLQPLIDGSFIVARSRQMMRKQFRLMID